jgi:hypothetical protein
MSGDSRQIERRSIDEKLLDSAIDAVAREMTQSGPSAALRARVLDAIEQGRQHHAPVIPRWAWAGAIAAAALAVATAVWISRPVLAPNGAVATVAERSDTAPQAPVTTRPNPPVETPRLPAARALSAPHGRLAAPVRSTRRDTGDFADDTNPVPALAEIEPLKFSTVDPDPLHTSAFEVAPLDIAPIPAIPGLEPGSTDDRSSEPNKEK